MRHLCQGSKEKFLLHPEIIIIAELKAIPQVNVLQRELQTNVMTRAHSRRREVEDVEQEMETESSSEDEMVSEKEQCSTRRKLSLGCVKALGLVEWMLCKSIKLLYASNINNNNSSLLFLFLLLLYIIIIIIVI